MVDLRTRIGTLVLDNPVMPASGTFSDNLDRVFPLDQLGALVTKTVTAELRTGNPVPRVAEVGHGMLNSIGIPSDGLPYFIDTLLPKYRQFKSPLVVSISAPTADLFADVARQLDLPGVAAIEANISCPNIEADGQAFAMHAKPTAMVIEKMRAATRLPLWVKLSPNTGDIAAVARAAADSGADALVVANTILAMAVDANTFRSRLGSLMAGYSGPAIKPIILRMVYQCAQAVNIPIIGCGGIVTADDAVEYMLLGASAVQVGTTTFVQPNAMSNMVQDLAAFCERKSISQVQDLVGALIRTDGELDDAESAHRAAQ